MSEKPNIIYTVGHSTLAIGSFIELLKSQKIELLADVRTIAKSRFNPQFNEDALSRELTDAGIEYEHFAGLGGFRHSRLKESPNTGWRSPNFKNYADYMMTPQFQISLEKLITEAIEKLTAIMCAEALPWRCHRNLISDALTVRGFQVMHIMGNKSIHEHAITAWAHVSGTDIIYPAHDA